MNVVNLLIQRIASSAIGAWILSRTLHHFDRVLLALTHDRTTLTGVLTGLPVVILVTIGAKSGLPRSTPLLYIKNANDQNSFAVVASNWGQRHFPAWYFNLIAHPRSICSIRGHSSEYIAHEAEGGEYERYWQSAANTYLGYPLYKNRARGRRIPILVMKRVDRDMPASK